MPRIEPGELPVCFQWTTLKLLRLLKVSVLVSLALNTSKGVADYAETSVNLHLGNNLRCP